MFGDNLRGRQWHPWRLKRDTVVKVSSASSYVCAAAAASTKLACGRNSVKRVTKAPGRRCNKGRKPTWSCAVPSLSLGEGPRCAWLARRPLKPSSLGPSCNEPKLGRATEERERERMRVGARPLALDAASRAELAIGRNWPAIRDYSRLAAGRGWSGIN